jgi:hypothetical protein
MRTLRAAHKDGRPAPYSATRPSTMPHPVVKPAVKLAGVALAVTLTLALAVLLAWTLVGSAMAHGALFASAPAPVAFYHPPFPGCPGAPIPC